MHTDHLDSVTARVPRFYATPLATKSVFPRREYREDENAPRDAQLITKGADMIVSLWVESTGRNAVGSLQSCAKGEDGLMGILKDKVAIVTGASRGIGRSIAEVFVREGAKVVICGRKQETLDQVACEIGKGVTPVACHVGKSDQIQNLVDSATREFGRIDILVNNAATNIAQEFCLDVDEAKFDKMVEINLKSAFRLIRQVAPGMCERGSGSIINVASISGLRPQYYGLLYSMTKAALIMMTQSYALELGPKGVRVNAIAPGLIQTVLSEYYWKDADRTEKIINQQPIQHLGQPAEIAEAALLLAADSASYLTGHTLVVDGGSLLTSSML
jgi:dehydrogenase/reductase SDR family member 4